MCIRDRDCARLGNPQKLALLTSDGTFQTSELDLSIEQARVLHSLSTQDRHPRIKLEVVVEGEEIPLLPFKEAESHETIRLANSRTLTVLPPSGFGGFRVELSLTQPDFDVAKKKLLTDQGTEFNSLYYACLLYTSPSPRDRTRSRMPSSA